MAFAFLKRCYIFTCSNHICISTDPDLKQNKVVGLPHRSQWPLSNLPFRIPADEGLCFNFFLSCSLSLLLFAWLSFHFRKQLFLHKLQSHSQQPVQLRQIAWGCSGTFYFIFSRSQCSLPGTTSITRAPKSPPRCQPWDPHAEDWWTDSQGRVCRAAAPVDDSLQEH